MVKLLIPDPLIECCTANEVFIKWENNWLAVPIFVIEDELQQWYEKKYLTDYKDEVNKLFSWLQRAKTTAYDWRKPEFIAELKEILKEELPGWIEAYKLFL